jgi:tetratricopeptide (TPR) repeat protein
MANLYVVRHPGGKTSSPLSADEIKKRIQRGEIKDTDELSLYPNQFAISAKEYPEFEEQFLAAKVKVNEFAEREESRVIPDTDNEKTLFFDKNKAAARDAESIHEEKTSIADVTKIREEIAKNNEENQNLAPVENTPTPVPIDEFSDHETQRQATVVFERPKELTQRDQPIARNTTKGRIQSLIPKRSFLVMMMLFLVAYEMWDEDTPNPNARTDVVMVPVRPQLPSGGANKVDPEMSAKLYGAGLKPYTEDTVQGYLRAVDYFQKALRLDPQNVKALGMLASSYLNLIDSSNKDENTFSVINKLIELSRLKQLDVVETLMAEVEFLATSRRYDAAIQRLVDYSKVSGKFDPILYYYLGWLYSLKGENANAMKYLNLIPASALPMPRLYYLRGYLHEENNEYDEATAEYGRALKLNNQHAKSILGLVRIAEKKGELKQVVRYVDFLYKNPSYQSPGEYIYTLIYRSKLALLFQHPDEAVTSLEQAIRIDPKNEDLRLEYYTLLSASGKDSRYKSLAQMYALILDGERNMRAGKIHEAQAVLLQAQDAFPKSSIPFEKMGDLFYATGEYERAQSNYKRALSIDPKAAEVAIKLIDSLIHNHEWDDAQKYLAKYRTHPKLKSSVDRLAGDLAFNQNNFTQAIQFYRKAMARDSIDTEVYSAYANALRELDQCKDAQFFYSIAQRLDPFNYNAILGAARCLLKTDSLDAAVGRIQEELSKLPKARADLLDGIAEIYSAAHDDDKALQFTAQAKDIDVDYPDSYRIEGEIYLRQMLTKKDAKAKALAAFKSYSDRKPSDPLGYLQRFEIFLKDSNFEAGADELDRVFQVSPRYPELHYRRAQMYERMGRTKDALSELEQELKLNPRLVKALVEQGNILSHGGNQEEAMKSYVKAMALDPQDASAKIGAGYINYLKHQYPSAIALYLAALSLDKGNPEIYKKIGIAYRDSGENAKAAQAFQSYLDLSPDAPDRADYEKYKRSY